MRLRRKVSKRGEKNSGNQKLAMWLLGIQPHLETIPYQEINEVEKQEKVQSK